MKDRVESVLGTQITDAEFDQIKFGWLAFCEEPERYAGSVVVDMVLLNLDEIRRVG